MVSRGKGCRLAAAHTSPASKSAWPYVSPLFMFSKDQATHCESWPLQPLSIWCCPNQLVNKNATTRNWKSKAIHPMPLICMLIRLQHEFPDRCDDKPFSMIFEWVLEFLSGTLWVFHYFLVLNYFFAKCTTQRVLGIGWHFIIKFFSPSIGPTALKRTLHQDVRFFLSLDEDVSC